MNQLAVVIVRLFRTIILSLLAFLTSSRRPISLSAFLDFQISIGKISHLVRNLKLSSSAGCGNINSKLQSNSEYLWRQILHLIFTEWLQLGRVPDNRMNAQSLPMLKACNHSLAINYHPISLTNITSKLFQNILTPNVMARLESITVSHLHQTGFRSHCSSEPVRRIHARHTSTNEKASSRRRFVILCYKAFDHVRYNHLLAKLSSLIFPGHQFRRLTNS